VAPLRGALGQAGHSETLSPNYIETLLAARDFDAIKETMAQPHSLLYLLLRHSCCWNMLPPLRAC
jgi:hypothetical protein